MRVRSSTSALFFLGLSGLSVACGGQAQDERVSDQFKNNGTGVAPSKGGSGGSGGAGGSVSKGGSGGSGGGGGSVSKGGSGGSGGGGGTMGKGGGPPMLCGDAICDFGAGESCATCPNDCGPCAGGSGGSGGSSGSGNCSHDVCGTGPALSPGCGKCETIVCQTDPFCCEREWDIACVVGAEGACGVDCGTGGTGGAGGGPGKGGAGGSIGKGGGGGSGQGGKGGGPSSVCGDSICDPNESCSTCPKDCGPCGNSCSHDVCIAGPPLGQNCSKCAAVVCQQDPFCCESFWDATCVSEASQCAPCGGGTAGAGGAPPQDCQSCAFGSCGPQVNACLQDKECQGCLGSADPSCLVNPRVKDLVVCTCNGSCAQSCTEECKVFGGGGTGGTGGSGGGTGGTGGGPSSICGDGVCDGQETCGSCTGDCGSCDCAHGVCFTGGKLEGSCSPCTQKVCSQDPFCCSTDWDDQCVQRAQNSCGPEVCAGGQPPKPDPYDACPGLPLTTLQKGSTVLLQGDTRIDRNDYEPSCVEGGVPGNDAVYAVQMGAKGTLVVQLQGSSELDPILSIKKVCQGPGPLCQNNGVGKGTSEDIKREVEAGETAYIVVDAASGTSGPFKLLLDLF